MHTQKRIQELFNYDPETGVFTWRIAPNNFYKAGSIAGTIKPNGYVRLYFDGKALLAHRAVWLYMYGELPKGQIDHINGIRRDNRIINLRDVSPSVNQQNQRRAKVNNKSGLLGAYFRKKDNVYVSHLQINGKKVQLGTFKTALEAHQAYLDAKRKLHEGCTI